MFTLICFNTRSIFLLNRRKLCNKTQPPCFPFQWPYNPSQGQSHCKQYSWLKLVVPISTAGTKKSGQIVCTQYPAFKFLPRKTGQPSSLMNMTDYTDSHVYLHKSDTHFYVTHKGNRSRVPDQNGVSQAWYIVEIHHSGQEPSKWASWQNKDMKATKLTTSTSMS